MKSSNSEREREREREREGEDEPPWWSGGDGGGAS